MTTPELESFALLATLSRLALVVVVLAALTVGSRWAARMRHALAVLTDDQPLLEPSRWTGRLALGLAVLGLLLIAVGSVLLVLPAGRDLARSGWRLRRSARCSSRSPRVC